MSRQYDTEYQALRSSAGEDDDEHDAPPSHNVVPQIRPDQNRSQWNHIEDLDDFFNQAYQYYQRSGFRLMVIEDVLLLVQFAFVTLFGSFLLTCVNYPRLFDGHGNTTSYSEVIYPVDTWGERISTFVLLCLIVASFVFLFRIVQFICNLFKYYRMRSFFLYAMKVCRSEMCNMTWHEVQRRLLEVQREVQMCIHKAELSELDIYHRMLRFKNYMVAMVNKDVLPIKFTLPYYGNYYFLSTGLKYNYELILFWGPWSPFQNNWELKADYKSIQKRKELAGRLAKHILYVGIINLILSPVIFLWQIMYSFFRYADLAKREPGSLGLRMWSHYAKLFLRHFNELDHEFNARLCRAYRPAEKYMRSFISPTGSLIAKHLSFVAGAVLGAHLLIAILDEDFLHVSHIVAVITGLGLIIAVCRTFIPDEHMVFMPEFLMRTILAQIHYMPDAWRGAANTFTVRDEFAELFQNKITYLVEELASPIITPFILCIRLRRKSLELVDFFRNFTVEVTGVGDVCSFAQMDVRRHGHPDWTTAPHTMEEFREGGREEDLDLQARDAFSGHRERAELGKTELSLMHFTLTNPEWRPRTTEDRFMNAIKTQAQREASMLSMLPAENPLLTSSNSLSMMGAGYNNMVLSTFHRSLLNLGIQPMSLASQPPQSIHPAQNLTSGPQAMNEALGGTSEAVSNQTDPQAAHLASSPPQSFPLNSPPIRPPQMQGRAPSMMRGTGMRHLDLPISSNYLGGGGSSGIGGGGLMASITQPTSLSPPFSTPPEAASMQGHQVMGGGPVSEGAMIEMMTAEMSFGALYMHDYHALKRSMKQSTGGFMSCGTALDDDESARRLWTSSFSSSASSSAQPGGAGGGSPGEVMIDVMRGSHYQSCQGAGSVRMPNIQEGSEDEEVLNNQARQGPSSGRPQRDPQLSAGSERDRLLQISGGEDIVNT